MPRDRAALGRALRWALIALVFLPRLASAAAAAASMSELSELMGEPSPSAPLELFVNGGSHGPVEVVLRGADALVSVDDLESAGLRGFEGRRESMDGCVWVSLASLAPALRYEVDEGALALRVTATPQLLGRAAIDLRPVVRPPGLEARGEPSGFLNYSIQRRTDWSTTADRSTTTGFAEAGASASGRLLYSSGQLLADGSAVRGMSNVTVDDVGSLRRLVVGDGFAGSSGLGGGVLLGGVSLAREYGLDPYFLRSPMPGVSGFATTPSTLDVYVNGVLTKQVPLSPGSYDVTNLPVTSGAGNVQTVLRDAFGRSEVLSWQYYYTPALLAPGLSDYAYSIGFRRLDYGRTSFDYGRPVFLARHRFGVTKGVTLGGRLDAAEDLVSGGPSTTFSLPVGTLELEAAGSAQARRLGGAASAGYSFVSRRFGGGALVRIMGDRYAHAALRAGDERARVQSSFYAGAPLTSRLNIGVNYSILDRRDGGFSDVLSARADLRLASALVLGLTGSQTRGRGDEPVREVFASLSWSFAPMSVADLSVQSRVRGDTGTFAGVQKGLPVGNGFGYRARAGSGPAGDAGTALVQYQWDHGRYEVQYDRVAPAFAGGSESQIGTASVMGGAVFLGDRFFLTQPVRNGYGLIRTGVPDVRGYAEGQEIGRTDRKGDLFVPSLLPYYGNRLGIADRDVPAEYSIGPTELLAAPTYRGGVVTSFELTPVRSAEGDLVTSVNGADVPPAFGELTVRAPGGAYTSPVGREGRFYLDGVPPGRHAGVVEWDKGRCTVTLVVPESPAMVDLGTVRCGPAALVDATRHEAPQKEPGAATVPHPVPLPASRGEGERDTPAAAERAGEGSKVSAAEPAAAATTIPATIPTAAAAPITTATATATPTPTPTRAPHPIPLPASRGEGEEELATPTATAVPAAAAQPVAPAPGHPKHPKHPVRRAPKCPGCAVCWSSCAEHLASDRSRADAPPPYADGRGGDLNVCRVDLSELCSSCLRERTYRRCSSRPRR